MLGEIFFKHFLTVPQNGIFSREDGMMVLFLNKSWPSSHLCYCRHVDILIYHIGTLNSPQCCWVWRNTLLSAQTSWTIHHHGLWKVDVFHFHPLWSELPFASQGAYKQWPMTFINEVQCQNVLWSIVSATCSWVLFKVIVYFPNRKSTIWGNL